MSAFDPTRVAALTLPGITTKHRLVRGMMPLVGSDFAYTEIEDALKVDLSTTRFVSLSLIDNTGERGMWAAEMKAFKVDPNVYPKENWPPYLHQPNWTPNKLLGTGDLVYGKSFFRQKANLIWWPIEGLSPIDDPKVFLGKPGWDLGGLVDFLYRMLLNAKSEETTYYFHCSRGADRTGALHAGLLLKSGLTRAEAIEVTSKATSAGAPNADYLRLIAAYADSLGRK